MTRGLRSGLTAAGFAAALALLVWATVAGPVGMLSASGRRREFVTPPPPLPPPPAEGTPLARNQRTSDRIDLDLSWIGELLAWALVLGLMAGAVLVGRWLWRNRWHRPAKPAEVEFDVLPESAVAEALRDDVSAQLAAVEEGDPRNGIVRCWLRLEEIVGAAGLPRNRWETSAEYTVRVLRTLDLDPRAIGRLSSLYREARFSDHLLDETARTAAASALRQLHDDLQQIERAGPRRGTGP